MVSLSGRKPRLASGRPRIGAPPKRVDPFYQSKEWLVLVARRKLDADYRAALARRKHPGERLILDHVRERKDGGADLDPANTQWLTHGEHQAKTAAARRARAGIE